MIKNFRGVLKFSTKKLKKYFRVKKFAEKFFEKIFER